MKTIRKAELKWARVSIARDSSEDVYEKRVSCSRDVSAIVKALIVDEVQEVFIALQLDNKNRVIGYQEVARGTGNACAVKPADVFRAAIIAGAISIIIAHNHPSGEPAPSAEDIALTKRIKRAGDLLGIAVLDHIVSAEKGHFSFADAGMLQCE
jgi:DNA repair protein RadC